MSILNGEISFKPLVLLRVGNSVIESHDISASELHNFVVASEQTISRHVGAMYRRELQNARNPESKVPPVIHIVRLALYEYSPAVFNVYGIEKIEKVTTKPQILTKSAREYWDAIEETAFEPQLNIRGAKATEGTSGIWLSLKTPK